MGIVTALDFGRHNDRLAVAPEARVSAVEGGQADLAPVLARCAAEGLSVEEAGGRLADTAHGSQAFGGGRVLLSGSASTRGGRILADATIGTTLHGDVIIALGVNPGQLLAAVGGEPKATAGPRRRWPGATRPSGRGSAHALRQQGMAAGGTSPPRTALPDAGGGGHRPASRWGYGTKSREVAEAAVAIGLL